MISVMTVEDMFKILAVLDALAAVTVSPAAVASVTFTKQLL